MKSAHPEARPSAAVTQSEGSPDLTITQIEQPQIVRSRQKLLLSLCETLPERLLYDHELPKTDNGALLNPASRIYSLLLSEEAKKFIRQDHEAAEGGALDSISSSLCILDYVRTKKFTDGIRAQIKELEILKPEGEIHVVDAGCGSLPILSMVAALSSERVRVTALEQTTDSIESANLTVSHFGLSDKINIISADATKVQLTSRPDLVISETLYTGFYDEPFIQIMANLVPQMSEVGRTIPEKITVELGVGTSQVRDEPQTERLNVPGVSDLRRFPQIDFAPKFVWEPGTPPNNIEMEFSLPLDEIKAGQKDVVFFRTRMLISKATEASPKIELTPDESYITESLCIFTLKNQALNASEKSEIPVTTISYTLSYPPGSGDLTVKQNLK